MQKLFDSAQTESTDIIDSYLKSIAKDFEQISEQLYKEILKKADLKKGQLQYDNNLVNLIRKILVELTNKSNYKDNVFKFIDKAKGVGSTDIKINKELGNKVSANVTNRLLNNTGIFIDGLTAGGYEVNVVNKVQSIVYNALKNNVSVLELQENLNNYFDIVDDTGDLYKYSKQVAQDSLYQYTGELNAGIASELGLNGIMYTPNILVEKSRPICKHIIKDYNGIMTNEQLLKLLAKADKDPKGLGAGMIDPTKTVSEFLKNRGGYNCLHKAYGTMV